MYVCTYISILAYTYMTCRLHTYMTMCSLGSSAFLLSHIPLQTSVHTVSRRKGGNYELHLVLNHFLLVLHVGLRKDGSEKE